MTYKELKERQQKEVNDFPFGFAFSNEQFDEMMNEWGLDSKNDLNKIVSIGAGGFVQKKDLNAMHEMFDRHSQELKDLRKNIKEMQEAFFYQMCNHEYGINLQRDYDVLSCFGNINYHGDNINELEMYFDELGFDDDLRQAYKKASKKYYKLALENEWF